MQVTKTHFNLNRMSCRAAPQVGKGNIAFFDQVAKPPKIKVKPGTRLFVPPGRNDSFLVKKQDGIFYNESFRTI